MELEIHHVDDGQAVGFFGPVLMRVITTAPSDHVALEQLREMTEAVSARWPMMGLWYIVHHGAPFPDSDFRRGLGVVLRPLRDRKIVMLTPLGLGFWASTAVALTFTLSKLMGQHVLVETTVERGASRLGMELIGVDAEKLVASHGVLLEKIQARTTVA